MLIKVWWFWHMWPPPWWSIHHSDQTCKGLLNLVIKIWNSICSICYNCIFHFSHISGQFDLSRIGSVIYHPDPIFEKSLNIKLEFWNSASDICYSHICAIATFFRNLISTNQGDLCTILIRFLRRFWIWSQKFENSTCSIYI